MDDSRHCVRRRHIPRSHFTPGGVPVQTAKLYALDAKRQIRNVDENLFVDYVVPRGTLATELVGEDGVDGDSSVYGDTERRRVRWD